MRNYECTHRRLGTLHIPANHAWDAQQKAAKEWGTCPTYVLAVLEDATIPLHKEVPIWQ